MTTWALIERLGEDVIFNGLGGSTLNDIRNRIKDKPEYRENPLLIWDGRPNGHILGSTDMEAAILADIAAWKTPHRNWLLVLPVPIFPDPPQFVADLREMKERFIRTYGPDHIYDPVPLLQDMSDGSPEDVADVAAGLVPRSIIYDGVHPNDDAKRVVAIALTLPGGPMARVRNL